MQPCPNCGTANKDAAKFCNACGRPMAASLAAGDMLQGRYLISRLLGKGGMGAVYQAQDTRLGNRSVAVKENFDATPEAQAQFKLEATTLAALNHPNLPRVNDHFIEPSGKQYLVMDFVEGEDLQALLDRKGCMAEAQVRPWIEQVCDALEYLHTQNPPIIHRDIKPANIKITPAGRAMLVDFGIAKQYRAGQKTMAAARAVTSGFSPPEQYGGARTDARSDVYALAATLYCLLTGQPPPDAMDRLTGAQFTPPRRANPATSAVTEAAIVRGLALTPQDRPQSVTAFLQMLGSAPQPAGARQAFNAPAFAPTALASAGAAALPRPVTPPPIAQPKPVVIPPTALGAPSVRTHDYATFARRAAATLIDGTILSCVVLVLGVLFTAVFGSAGAGTGLTMLLSLLLYWWYYTDSYARSGQTPGKRVVGIRVVAADGSYLTRGRATGRAIMYLVEGVLAYGFIGLLGYLWMAWDKDRQTWHDKVAGSYVIRG